MTINLLKVLEVLVLIAIWILFNYIHKLIFGYPAWFLSLVLLILAINFIVNEN